MNRIHVLILLLLLIFSAAAPSAGQEITFRDVPEGHWARNAVYDLVKKGITQGYPDGTFRGNRNITRYETAMFLSKLAAIVDTSSQIDVSSLKADIKALKEEIEELKKAPPAEAQGIPVTGSFKARYRVANTVTTGVSEELPAPERGPRVDYRLNLTLAKNFGEDAGVKVNLDTMDAGWNGGAEDFARKLLDLEGNLVVYPGDVPVNIKMTAGPGPVVYTPTMDATIPSEIGTVYERPRNTLFASTYLGALELKLGYTARTISQTGEVDVSQLTAGMGYTFVGLPLFELFRINVTGDQLSKDILKDAEPADTRGKLELSGTLNETTLTTLTLGSSKSQNPNEGYYIGWELDLADPWGTGTYATVKYNKIGPEYIVSDLATAEFDIVGLDFFDKALPNNVQSWGLDLTQYMTRYLSLKAKVDVRMAENGEYGEDYEECSTTIEGGLSYNIAQNTLLDLMYKVYQVPSIKEDTSTDVLSLSFLYKF